VILLWSFRDYRCTTINMSFFPDNNKKIQNRYTKELLHTICSPFNALSLQQSLKFFLCTFLTTLTQILSMHFPYNNHTNSFYALSLQQSHKFSLCTFFTTITQILSIHFPYNNHTNSSASKRFSKIIYESLSSLF
jgi:hypothetical protein